VTARDFLPLVQVILICFFAGVLVADGFGAGLFATGAGELFGVTLGVTFTDGLALGFGVTTTVIDLQLTTGLLLELVAFAVVQTLITSVAGFVALGVGDGVGMGVGVGVGDTVGFTVGDGVGVGLVDAV